MVGAGEVNGDGWWPGCMEGRVGPWQDHGRGTRLTAWEYFTERVVVWDERGGAGGVAGWMEGWSRVGGQADEWVGTLGLGLGGDW